MTTMYLRHALAHSRLQPAAHVLVAQGIARVEEARGGGTDERAADLVFALDGSPQVCTSTLPNVEGQLHLVWGLGLGFRV